VNTLGTVQVILNITDEIKRRIISGAEGADVAVNWKLAYCGDMAHTFLEAIRQLQSRIGARVHVMHLTLVLTFVNGGGCNKKPKAQLSIPERASSMYQPDYSYLSFWVLLKRQSGKKCLFTSVEERCLFSLPDADTHYRSLNCWMPMAG